MWEKIFTFKYGPDIWEIVSNKKLLLCLEATKEDLKKLGAR
jgi:hypothetical protein